MSVASRKFTDELTSRLSVEYAGSVPPGRILACVVRTEHRMLGVHLEPASRRDLIESSVRRDLAQAAARPHSEEPLVPRSSVVISRSVDRFRRSFRRLRTVASLAQGVDNAARGLEMSKPA